MIDRNDTTISQKAVIQTVSNLAIVYRDVRIASFYAKAIVVMNHAVCHHQLRRITEDGVLSIADFTVSHLVTQRWLQQSDASPLSAYAVVWQVIEHVVQTIATQQAVLCQQSSTNRKMCAIVKVELRAA